MLTALLVTGCGPGGGGPSPSPSAAASADATPSPIATPSANATTSELPSPSSQPSTDTRPVIGDIELSPQNVACTYVPHGNLDGTDSLTVFAYVLLIGANSLPGPLRTAYSLSNGFSATSTGAPNNQATAFFQGPIRAGDWGSRLTMTIRADAEDTYRESNESNNQITVAVNLPAARPNTTVDPLPCTAGR